LTWLVATRILLLRHAQSSWNAEGRWQGWADAPLTSAGEEAVRAVAMDAVLDPVVGVVASDLERAWRTASIIADARGLPSVVTMRGLRERGAGLWEGLTRPEIEEGWPGAFATPVTVIPGGEARRAVLARAVGAVHRIADAWPSSTVLAVTHGGVIRLVEEHAGGPHEAVPNLSGRWVTVAVGHIELGPRVALTAVTDLDPIASAEQ
jgi:broad specificity phosphatase PhoE